MKLTESPRLTVKTLDDLTDQEAEFAIAALESEADKLEAMLRQTRENMEMALGRALPGKRFLVSVEY